MATIPSDATTDIVRHAASLLELGPDAVVIINTSGDIMLVNAQCETLFGYSRDELIGRPVEILVPERFHDAHDQHRVAYLDRPGMRPMGAGLELYGIRKDGEEFPVDISLAKFQTEDQLFIAAAVRDITDRKKLEAIRDKFIANAAHELRTPLTAIRMGVELFARRGTDLSDEQRAKAMDALLRQCERSTDLVTNLLDLSNIEGKRLKLAKQLIEVGSAIRQLVVTAAPPTGVTVEQEVAAGVSVFADPMRLDQILNNLLTNAYRYGGPRVTLEATTNDGWTDIAVVDDGPGVDGKVADIMFEPFACGIDAGAVGGSGLGLAVCQSLVEAHGGTIWHERVEPHGARIVFRLRSTK